MVAVSQSERKVVLDDSKSDLPQATLTCASSSRQRQGIHHCNQNRRKSSMPTSSRVKHELEEDPDCQVCECKFGPTLLKQLQMPSMSHILPGPKSY